MHKRKPAVLDSILNGFPFFWIGGTLVLGMALALVFLYEKAGKYGKNRSANPKKPHMMALGTPISHSPRVTAMTVATAIAASTS